VAQIIDRIRMLDDQPLSVCRSANARLIVVYRHFTVLFAALLRETGIPARGRCGFGTYFRSGRFVDHWVCEYWNAPEARWVLVDAFIAAEQREKLRPDFNPLDVPRDRFVVGQIKSQA
jgi:Transglutaminase-like superfamily